MKNYLNESLSAQERAEALVNEMTVEEAASQLRYDAPAVERLGIPAYNWWNEGIHGLARSGVATMFPQAIGLAAMFDTDLVFKVADITSTEARAKYNEYSKRDDRDIYKGLTLWAPNINIFRDPRWGRGHETYGEDPYLTAECGKAYVKGLQGSGKVLKTAACAKHFAVHSGPEAVRHEFNAEVSWKDLEETYLYAFEELVKKAKVEGVMGAYNRVNGEPSCASEFLMGKLDKWGFDGYFVSDCWAIRDFHEHHMVTSSPVESAAMALKAGCNVNCGCTYVHLLSALDKGLVTEDEIRASCVALMRTRIRLGMFDKSTEYDNIPYKVVSCPEHKEVSYQCAVKSMVLLKNKGILPLDKKSISTIAVIGPNADSRAALEGNYNGTADRYVTFLDGIEDAFDGRVIYAEGCHLYKDRVSGLAQAGDRYAEAEAAAANSDVVILCVKIGMDTVILPGCVLEGNTEIGEDCEIGPNSRLTDTKLGNGVKFQTSTAIESEIGNETTVGPFAYIRPNCHIGNRVKVGDFVEVKNSTIGDGTKIPHLSYVGDTDAGEKINFGCGSIMVNYDGKKKHRTTIEDNVFVGCNVNLVAPVTVKKGSYIAAGSTITKDVPEDVLAVARARQQVIEGWTKKRIER